jgi:hypothetical protein
MPHPGFDVADDLLAPMTRITCPAPDTSGPSCLPLADAMSSDSPSLSACTSADGIVGRPGQRAHLTALHSLSIRYSRVVLTVETAFLPGSARSIERTLTSGAGW